MTPENEACVPENGLHQTGRHTGSDLIRKKKTQGKKKQSSTTSSRGALHSREKKANPTLLREMRGKRVKNIEQESPRPVASGERQGDQTGDEDEGTLKSLKETRSEPTKKREARSKKKNSDAKNGPGTKIEKERSLKKSELVLSLKLQKGPKRKSTKGGARATLGCGRKKSKQTTKLRS